MFIWTKLSFKGRSDHRKILWIFLKYLSSPIILFCYYLIIHNVFIRYWSDIFEVLQHHRYFCILSYHVYYYMHWTSTNILILFYIFYLLIIWPLCLSGCCNGQASWSIGYWWPKNPFFDFLDIVRTIIAFSSTQTIIFFHYIHFK